ncbi:MAG: thioredoxin family protein [Desulfatiglandaceae bacterium]
MTNLRNLITVCIIICGMPVVSWTGGPNAEDQAQTGRGLHYTCRDDGGKLIVTTEKAVAESSEDTKSRVFLEKESYEPVDITDYEPGKIGKKKDSLEYLEDVLVKKLAGEAVSWPIGTERTLEVYAETQDHLPASEREIQLARTKSLPKKKIYDKSIFTAMTGSKAALGEPVNLNFGIEGKVVAVRENEVEVHFAPESEIPLEGPFGPVIVRDKGNSLVTEIEMQKGDLVKLGVIVGQIAEVGESTFRVDYNHPFGGRTLTCDVAVKALDRPLTPSMQATQKDAAGANPPASAITATETPTQSSIEKDEHFKVVETGDIVTVAYSATLESGELLRTTDADIASNPDQKTIKGFWQDAFGPETIIAGGQEDFPGLGHAVLGLQKGDQQKVVVPPQNAFGMRDMKQVFQYDRTRIIPATVTMPAREYTSRFGGFPVKDKTVSYNAYVNAQIVDVSEKGAVLKLFPVEEEINDVFGKTRMKVIDDNIHLHLTPKLGANFELGKRKGRVIAVDSLKFTVDFNDPLAGKNLVYDLKVLDLTKAAEFSDLNIQWIEDYEKGMQAIEEMKKPAVLVLYADWCGYSKKLFDTTLQDPRIKMMKDDFVWVKVDSHEQSDLKQLYEQTGFPMTVLLDAGYNKIEVIDGFRPANEFKAALEKALNDVKIGAKLKAKSQMKEET